MGEPPANRRPRPPDAKKKKRPAQSDELGQARDLGIDTCGRIAEFWGFTRTMGRVFGMLYLSADPVTQPEIQERLAISAGNASMTLAGLLRWGVVHKVWIRGKRRDHYRAETDFWKMISGVLNQRERREISAALELVGEARKRVRLARKKKSAASKAELDFAAGRLQRLHEICQMGETMLDMLLGHLKLDVERFRDVLNVEGK